MHRKQLTKYAWLSIAAALVTILLKVTAYFLTYSVGLLSDALESGVNLVAALLALASLSIAAQPPDEDHAYGHAKAEYFSVGAEGALILIAAASIAYSAARRLLDPQPLDQLGIGLLISITAALINLGVSLILRKAGEENDSIALKADAAHLMTDVWTSGGVALGVGAVALTGWTILDPLIALAVAVHILYAGAKLVRHAVLGLMDTSLPESEMTKVVDVLERYKSAQDIQYHALRSRQSGAQRFVSVHIQVPGVMTVQEGHMLMEEIEADVRGELPLTTVFTHLEPVEDPASWHDISIYRKDS